MDLSGAQLLEIAQFSIVRMDGAWFMALARELGVETAWKMDVEAWKQFSYVFGKKIKKDFISEPIWPDSFIEATEILFKIMNQGFDSFLLLCFFCQLQRSQEFPEGFMAKDIMISIVFGNNAGPLPQVIAKGRCPGLFIQCIQYRLHIVMHFFFGHFIFF